MRKTKQAVDRTVRCFADELKQRFPELTFEPVLDIEDGNDAWLYVFVPRNGTDETDVRDAAREIEDRLWREVSISVVAMIREQKEPVHG
jgi:hypothetical protein